MQNLFVLLAAILVGWLVQYLLLRRRIDRSTQIPAQLEQVREEVGRMVVQLNQTTDRNVSLLEDRIRQLTELLAKADRKIGLLRREGEKHEVSQSVYNHLVKSRPAAPAAEGAEEGPERKDRREEILRLHRAGFTPPAIARQINMSLGEVELVISLAEGAR